MLPVRGAMKVLPVRGRAVKVVLVHGRAIMKVVMKAVVRADEVRRGRGAAGEEKRAAAARERGRDARERSADRPPVVGLRPRVPSGSCATSRFDIEVQEVPYGVFLRFFCLPVFHEN
jgi:hypothetical protein